MAALAQARKLLPKVFCDTASPPPADTAGRLIAAGISDQAARDVVLWQCRKSWHLEALRQAAAISARDAARPIAESLLPEVFREQDPPPVPPFAHALLVEAGVSKQAANDWLAWWCRRPQYRAAAARRKVQRQGDRQERRGEALALIRSLAPELFDFETPRPLEIGVLEQLVELGVEPPQSAADALAFWTSREEYRRAIAAGGSRFGLDGSIAGEISPEDREAARQAIAEAEATALAAAEAAR